MNLKKRLYGIFILTILIQSVTHAQTEFTLSTNFTDHVPKYEIISRGVVKAENGVLTTKEAYATFGENNWKDYEITFKARTAAHEKEVQIWSGFRASSRNDRYILGLKGGIQNDLYLARLGYMGTDDFLALRHLDFPLTPGKWYDIKIQVVGDRIKVFLNNEKLPRIDVRDQYSRFSPNGKVVLGGSWLTNEFDDLKIRSITKEDFPSARIAEYKLPAINKAQQREKERSTYKEIKVNKLDKGRTEISLNGKWLFSPNYEVKDENHALQLSGDDSKWHLINVPDFWNRNREWLHGERYGTASKGTSDNYFQKEIERCEAQTFDYIKTSVGYYRHWIELPDDIKDKNLELNFDAVSKVGEVYVNGKKLAHHIGMFGEFKVNASDVLKPGKNLIAVKVARDYVKDIKDADEVKDVAVTVAVTNKMLKDLAHGFYGGDPAGIWQPVKLVISDKLRIEDVFIKPTLEGGTFDVTVKNNSNKQKEFSVHTTIKEDKTKAILHDGESLKAIKLKAGEEKTFSYNISGLKPKLWSPATPNLYDFSFVIKEQKTNLDEKVITSGFRTFESKGDFLYLNGNKYWLRGGNHTPMSLAPNDTLLAHSFSKMMREGNMAVTRTHTSPYNELWMSVSDQYGIGVSYEGQWPWLMIKESMPDKNLIDLWETEFYDLIKKYRNHPSLLIWTVNNEMKFYENDPDFERAKRKMKIISDVVKKMRELDPTRPIVFDSNYKRNEKKYGKEFFKTIDDGDIDDPHWYVNWYHGSIFSEFDGQWQDRFKNPGRPLISQEFATGYPSETGHPTRFYTYVHQNPATLVGDYAYEFADPKYFLEAQSFITKESAEAIRRTNEKAAGIMHFASLTWFKNIHEYDKLAPHSTYYAMKNALQPILVSAEIWGRHFYAGEKLPTRIYVVNDSDDSRALKETELTWFIKDEKGGVIATGKNKIDAVPHYGRKWIDPAIVIPANLPKDKIYGKLELKLTEAGKLVSENEYAILIASKDWMGVKALANKKIVVVDTDQEISPVLAYQAIKYQSVNNIADAIKQKPDVLIFRKSQHEDQLRLKQLINAFVKSGGKVLLLKGENLATELYPERVRGVIREDGEIFSMEIPESPVFDGIDPMDMRYFNNEKRENPLVSKVVYQVNRASDTQPLAVFTKVHGYLNGDIDERAKTLDGWRGYPIVKIKDSKGAIILSEVLLEKGNTDPIAGKLLINMLKDLLIQ